MEALSTPPLSDKIESVFILGGSSVYEASALCSVTMVTLYNTCTVYCRYGVLLLRANISFIGVICGSVLMGSKFKVVDR